MLNKSFFLFFFLLIVSQVLFSFYYSSEIINQNNLISINEIALQSLKIENQDLEKKFTSTTSLNQTQILVNQRNYINLKETLNLQN
jgi:hypothetical protein